MVKKGSRSERQPLENVSTPMDDQSQLLIFKSSKCCQKYLFYFVSRKVIQDVILYTTLVVDSNPDSGGIGILLFITFETNKPPSHLPRPRNRHNRSLVTKVERPWSDLLEYAPRDHCRGHREVRCAGKGGKNRDQKDGSSDPNDPAWTDRHHPGEAQQKHGEKEPLIPKHGGYGI
jgi:hypothetical protein